MIRYGIVIFMAIIGALRAFAIDYEQEFVRIGFADVQELDSTIVVDLKYAGTDNFMGVNMYGDLSRAYLRPEVAARLIDAQRRLKNKSNDYALVVYDAARPLSAQKMMYDKVQGTEFEQYVANPYSGGHHCYGCAVDVSILYKGGPLDMGTGFDNFSPLSHTDNELSNLENGSLSREAFANRKLLREVMTSVGFDVESCEWWHFSCYKIEDVRKNYPRLDF